VIGTGYGQSVGYWKTNAAIGTDVGGASNDSGELYVGGGVLNHLNSFTLQGWINDASTTTNRGTFALGAFTTLTIQDGTGGVHPNIGADSRIGFNSALQVDGEDSTCDQQFDVTMNNGAPITIGNQATWKVNGTADIKIQSGVTPGNLANNGMFKVAGTDSCTEWLPFYNTYTGTIGAGVSGELFLDVSSNLTLVTTFTADGHICVLKQTGSDANGKAGIDLCNGSKLSTHTGSTGACYLDIVDGDINLYGNAGSNVATTIDGFVQTVNSNTEIDVDVSATTFSLNTLTITNDLIMKAGNFHTAIEYSNDTADKIVVNGTANLTGAGTLVIVNFYDYPTGGDHTWINVITTTGLTSDFSGINDTRFSYRASSNNVQIKHN